MSIENIITIAVAVLGGGTVGAFIQKLLLGKKDAADIAQDMVKMLFDQQQTMQTKLDALDLEVHDLREKLVAATAENIKLKNEQAIMEKQLQKQQAENAEQSKKIANLSKQYQTLLVEYKALSTTH